MIDANEDWYGASIRKSWDRKEVQDAIVKKLIELTGEDDLEEIENAVFGPRVEHAVCGSGVLPGTPICWGCEEILNVVPPVI